MSFTKPLREKCPNTEYLSVFSQNAGKCEPEETRNKDTFHAVTSFFNIFIKTQLMHYM